MNKQFDHAAVGCACEEEGRGGGGRYEERERERERRISYGGAGSDIGGVWGGRLSYECGGGMVRGFGSGDRLS